MIGLGRLLPAFWRITYCWAPMEMLSNKGGAHTTGDVSSNATVEAMADDMDSHPTALLQEYTMARDIHVRTALFVQDVSTVRDQV
ncbi:unnamed protein product [Sphagnum troendelagicum]|uniref:Uncharacterized protein n=1 Tax=Sphagnum troendelagicum TaxID=128251 RepID=A0ABP0U632_9BRYO